MVGKHICDSVWQDPMWSLSPVTQSTIKNLPTLFLTNCSGKEDGVEGLCMTCHCGAGGQKGSLDGARIPVHYGSWSFTWSQLQKSQPYMVVLALLKVTWFKTLQDKVSLRIPLRIKNPYWISWYSEWTGVGMQPLLFHVPSASFSLWRDMHGCTEERMG